MGKFSSAAAIAGLASYVSVRWLTHYFQTRTLIPFAHLLPRRRRHRIIRFA